MIMNRLNKTYLSPIKGTGFGLDPFSTTKPNINWNIPNEEDIIKPNKNIISHNYNIMNEFDENPFINLKSPFDNPIYNINSNDPLDINIPPTNQKFNQIGIGMDELFDVNQQLQDENNELRNLIPAETLMLFEVNKNLSDLYNRLVKISFKILGVLKIEDIGVNLEPNVLNQLQGIVNYIETQLIVYKEQRYQILAQKVNVIKKDIENFVNIATKQSSENFAKEFMLDEINKIKTELLAVQALVNKELENAKNKSSNYINGRPVNVNEINAIFKEIENNINTEINKCSIYSNYGDENEMEGTICNDRFRQNVQNILNKAKEGLVGQGIISSSSIITKPNI